MLAHVGISTLLWYTRYLQTLIPEAYGAWGALRTFFPKTTVVYSYKLNGNAYASFTTINASERLTENLRTWKNDGRNFCLSSLNPGKNFQNVQVI